MKSCSSQEHHVVIHDNGENRQHVDWLYKTLEEHFSQRPVNLFVSIFNNGKQSLLALHHADNEENGHAAVKQLAHLFGVTKYQALSALEETGRCTFLFDSRSRNETRKVIGCCLIHSCLSFSPLSASRLFHRVGRQSSKLGPLDRFKLFSQE